MRKLWLLLTVLLTTIVGFAQQNFEVSGIVIDTAGQPLQGVSVRLLHDKDSSLSITDKTGAYSFSRISSNNFTLKYSYTGLRPLSQAYTKNNNSLVFQIQPVVMLPSTGVMDSIVITSVRPMIIKEDTVQYNVSAYKVREGAPIEDVIKKLPGVVVDKDGNIEAQGKKVARVRVNGKDFFGGDVQTATQNLPADIIDNIQVIDDYGDQANLTGVKTGDPEKIININVQRNKNKGTFGNAVVAGGNEGRYAGNTFINNFHEERQISFLGAINNTNANLFNFNGGGRGGGARGANFGNDSRGGAGGPGITLSKSAGLNFRDKWGQKLSFYGSYSFSARNTNMISSSFSQDNVLTRTTQRESNSNTKSLNQRLTLNLEYEMDSFNYFKASPYLSYSHSNGQSQSRTEINSSRAYSLNNNSSTSDNNAPNGGGSLLYNHRFGRSGRNFSAYVSVDYSDNNSDRYSNGTYHDIDSTYGTALLKDRLQVYSINSQSRNTRTNVHLSYLEPLNANKNTFLELNYDWNKSSTESIRDWYDFPDSASKAGQFNLDQSNHYNYQFLTNKAGISIKGQKEKYNYSVGIQVQPSKLTGTSIGKNVSTDYNNVNWMPSARFVYNFARNNSLTATLNGTAREPSFTQLQPVTDSSNLTNIVIGNPDLKNEFTNTLSIRYNKFDPKSGSSMFFNFSYDRTNDKIVTSRDSISPTRLRTSYLNTDGFNGYSGNASFTQPFSNRKYSVGASMYGSFDNNISYTNGYRNKGQNWNLRPGANFRLDLENHVDLMLRGDYTIYQTSTRYAAYTKTTKAQTLNVGLNGKNYFGDLTFGYDFTKVMNYGINSSVNSNPTLLSLYTEYRMLKGKMMTLRLQGFNLLNQNTGVTHTVNNQTITDSRINTLGRYFLFSVNIRLAKFVGSGGRGMMRREMRGMRDDNGGGGGGMRGGGGRRG